MDTEPVIEVTIATTRLRLIRSTDGIVASRFVVTPTGEPLQLRRWRFTVPEATAAANKLLDEALAAGEAEARALRTTAEQATRRAIAAGHRMRPTAGARRMLETAAAAAMNAYLNQSQEIARQCANAQARLTAAGFPTIERDVPEWIAEVHRILSGADDNAPATR